MDTVRTLFGMIVFIAICWLLSSNRKRVSMRFLASCLVLQVVLALIMLKTPVGTALFDFANYALLTLFESVGEGSEFIFGDLVSTAPFFAKVLPTVVVMSALMALLYHWGIMQRIVWLFGILFEKLLGTSGAESLSASANIFMGQTEAPLVVRPYLPNMTSSELMVVMTGGMATVAGGVMAAYVGMLESKFPDIAGHLVTASIISAPAALMFAKLMIPETQKAETAGGADLSFKPESKSALHAIALGTKEGIPLLFNILFMLLVFLAAIHFGNTLWGAFCGKLSAWGWADTSSYDSIQELLAYLFTPIAWLLGVSTQDLQPAAMLLGEKTVFNEFVAYGHMGDILNGKPPFPGAVPHEFTERSKLILAYALCGFANFSSIGILIGGLGILAEKRTAEIAAMGLKAMVAASFACFLTAGFAALLS